MADFEQLLEENVSLAAMTTLGVGGPARFFADVTSARLLGEGVGWARSRGLPLFILGGGSNIVVADGGFAGLVLRLSIRGIESQIEGDCVTVRAGAGEEWDPLVAMCVANDWAGVECLSGIPGRVGATPIQNVGAYGQETSETLTHVEAFDLATEAPVELSAGECRFGYRMSRFKSEDRGRFIITRVSYRLKVFGRPAIRYAELERHLTERGISEPRLADAREAVLTIRRRKAMVIDPADADSRSVGSFFVNPIVTPEELERIKERAGEMVTGRSEMPVFPAAEGRVKLSAAWLIERAGFARGHLHGNVGTSTKHALAIINRGGGTGGEVLELAEAIRSRVKERFGLSLMPEPVFVGFEGGGFTSHKTCE